MASEVLAMLLLGYLLLIVSCAFSSSSIKSAKPLLIVSLLISAFWYFMVTGKIIRGIMSWYANAGWEIAGGNLLEEAAVPMANVVLVIAWYSTSILLVMVMKRLFKKRGA
jgi:hypothetical protein